MAHNFSFGSGTQPKQSTPFFSFSNAQTSHKKSNEPANTEFSFGSGVHQSTQPTTNTGIPVNNQRSSVGFSFGSKSSNITLPQPATTTLTTQQQIERGRPGFSFGNAQTSHQKSNEPNRQEKTEEEVVQLRKEVKLLRKKLKEMAIVEERVKPLENLQYNKDAKVLLLGDSGVGKSALVSSHLSGEFERYHLATTEIDIKPLSFHHNKGTILFETWEISKEVQNKDIMCTGADCAIIMFDVTSRASYENAVNVHIPAVRKVCGGIPIVLQGNKIDILLSSSTVKFSVDLCHLGGNVRYYASSVKRHFNLAEPFRWLMRKLLRCNELDFVEVSAQAAASPEAVMTCDELLALPDFNKVDEATKLKYALQVVAAATIPLPEDDDEDL